MSRKVLITVTVVWAILVGGGFAAFAAAATFSYTSLDKTTERSSRAVEKYRWNGEPILLTSSQRNKIVHCQVVPDKGEARNVNSQFSVRRNYIKETTSWFSGSATVDCTSPATIRSGTGLKMYKLVKNRAVLAGVAVVGAGPLAAAFVFGSRKKVRQ